MEGDPQARTGRVRSPGGTKESSRPAKSDTFSIFACHPCAGAMLIFSVSFQFLRMTPKSSETYEGTPTS